MKHINSILIFGFIYRVSCVFCYFIYYCTNSYYLLSSKYIMPEGSKISKTERGGSDNGVKLLGIPFVSIRKSDLYYFFLPAFYFIILVIVYYYISTYGFHRPGTYLTVIFDFIQQYKYELLLFIVPFGFIFFYLLGIIISKISSTILSSFSKHADQVIQKETYNQVGYTEQIIESLNSFYKCNIKENDLEKSTIYWFIFNYVMDYYYGQENVYDDLRKAIFIRNLIGANIIFLIIIIYIMSLNSYIERFDFLIFVFICFISGFFYHIYRTSIGAYHRKLLRTYIYISKYISNLESNVIDKNK